MRHLRFFMKYFFILFSSNKIFAVGLLFSETRIRRLRDFSRDTNILVYFSERNTIHPVRRGEINASPTSHYCGQYFPRPISNLRLYPIISSTHISRSSYVLLYTFPTTSKRYSMIYFSTLRLECMILYYVYSYNIEVLSRWVNPYFIHFNVIISIRATTACVDVIS